MPALSKGYRNCLRSHCVPRDTCVTCNTRDKRKINIYVLANDARGGFAHEVPSHHSYVAVHYGTDSPCGRVSKPAGRNLRDQGFSVQVGRTFAGGKAPLSHAGQTTEGFEREGHECNPDHARDGWLGQELLK